MNNIQNYGNVNANSNYGKVNKSPNFKAKQVSELSEVDFAKYYLNSTTTKPKTLKNVLLKGNLDDWMNFICKKLGLKKP